MKEIKVLSTTATLGYRSPLGSFQAGLERGPNVIALDTGSTDTGLHYMGAGREKMFIRPSRRP